MLHLMTFVLLLVSIILVDYIFREARTRWQAFQQARRILGEHPEMKGVDPEEDCLLYTSPSPRDRTRSRMPSSA